MKVFGFFSSRRKGATTEPVTSIGADDHAGGTAVAERDEAPQDTSDEVESGLAPERLDDASDAAFDAEFDAEFDSAFASAAASAGNSGGAADAVANRDLFVGIAARQSRPVKDFVRQLLRGPATKDWIGMCRPVLSSTLEAAEGVELEEVVGLLRDLDEALSMAQAEDGAMVEGETRDLVLSCYEELQMLMPDAFGLDEVDGRRDSILVHALLRQVPDVGHVTLEKLYAAGFTSIEVLRQASAEDLAVTTGIREPLAREIAECVCRHDQWRQQVGAGGERARYDESLAERVAELRRQHAAYERAAEAEVTDASRIDDKREHRRLREQAELAIEVVLAEMDALEMLEQVQKLSIERRIESLEGFLKSGSTPPAASV